MCKTSKTIPTKERRERGRDREKRERQRKKRDRQTETEKRERESSSMYVYVGAYVMFYFSTGNTLIIIILWHLPREDFQQRHPLIRYMMCPTQNNFPPSLVTLWAPRPSRSPAPVQPLSKITVSTCTSLWHYWHNLDKLLHLFNVFIIL